MFLLQITCGAYLASGLLKVETVVLSVTTTTELPSMCFFNWSRSAYGSSYAHLGVSFSGALQIFEGDISMGSYGVAIDCSRWSRRTSEGSSSHLWVTISDGTPSSYVTGNHNSGAFYTLGVAMCVLFLSVEEFCHRLQ